MKHAEHPLPQSMEQILTLDMLTPTRFEARTHQTNRNRTLYGGQLIGQAFAAAQTTAPKRLPHSLQLCFQGPTTPQHGVIYDVEITRDGGSLSTRRVVATQSGVPVAFAIASFRDPEPGHAHEQEWRQAPPAPETLPTLSELSKHYADRVKAHGKGRLGCYPQLDVRPIDPETHLLIRPGKACGRYWIRAQIPPSSSAAFCYSTLAYLSDYLMVNAALIPHVDELPERRMFVASLNHTLWFHQFVDPGDWLLYETSSPWAGAGHALIHGHFYSRDGRLLASASQEAMIRNLDADAPQNI